jgi:hypothetical protein
MKIIVQLEPESGEWALGESEDADVVLAGDASNRRSTQLLRMLAASRDRWQQAMSDGQPERALCHAHIRWVLLQELRMAPPIRLSATWAL